MHSFLIIQRNDNYLVIIKLHKVMIFSYFSLRLNRSESKLKETLLPGAITQFYYGNNTKS